MVSNANGVNQNKNVNEVGAQNAHQPKTAENLSKLHGNSPETIRRDATAAKTIDAIGQASDTTKAKRLSGEAKIPKKELEKLAATPENEVKKVAKKKKGGSMLCEAGLGMPAL